MRLTCAVAGSAGLRIRVGPCIDKPRVVLLNDGSRSRPGLLHAAGCVLAHSDVVLASPISAKAKGAAG